jgi:integrase
MALVVNRLVGAFACLRRPLIATLVFAGLRISEALALRWRDVDLAGAPPRGGLEDRRRGALGADDAGPACRV